MPRGCRAAGRVHVGSVLIVRDKVAPWLPRRPQTGKFREPKDVLHKSWLLSELFRRSLGYVDGAAGHKNLKHMADKIEYHAP